MLSPENNLPSPETLATNQKTTPQKPPQEQPALKCPRCDSSNTKFCYYNNYSLTQPRHFCKNCRRYWTRGGALRNVPIGGGCRKTTKKLKTTSAITSTTSCISAGGGGGEFGPGFKFLTPNLNPGSTPVIDFHLGGLSLPKLHPATAGVYTQFITSSVPTSGGGHGTDGPYFGLDLLGLNYFPHSLSSTSSLAQNNVRGNENQVTISSIESLSSINQEMHWKLQQQRLAMIYGPSLQDEENKSGDQEKDEGAINVLKNLEINHNNSSSNVARKLAVGPTEWLFDQIQTSCSANDNYY